MQDNLQSSTEKKIVSIACNIFFLTEIIKPVLELARSTTPNDHKQKILDYGLKCDIAYENLNKIDLLLKEKMQTSSHINKRAYRLGNKIHCKL